MQPSHLSPKKAGYIQTAYWEGLQTHAITQLMLCASLLWIKTLLGSILAVKRCRALALVCIDEARLPAQTFHRWFKLWPSFVKIFINLSASLGHPKGTWIPCTALAVTHQKLLLSPYTLDEIQVKCLTKVHCTQEVKTRLKVWFGPSTGPSIMMHIEIWLQSERH